MLAVDTNVLIRLLVDDPGALDQCQTAREQVAGADNVLIGQVALVETVWVLHRSYRLPKARIAEVVRTVLSHPHYRVDGRDLLRDALDVFRSSNVEFADAVLLCQARKAGCSLKTFDRRLARLAGAELLS